MARVGMGVWCAVALVFMLVPLNTECREVTHEDIRDAMLSLVHMFRTSEDKLQKHEYREKTLGDQLKKILISIEKKHRALEPLKGMISRLDERLSNVETILLQKEEREKAVQQKTNDALETIQKSLKELTDGQRASSQMNITSVGGNITSSLEQTNTKLDALKKDMSNLSQTLSMEGVKAMCLELGSDGNPLERHISEAEKLLNKYELKLSEHANNTRVQTDFVPLNEIAFADEAWHSKMTEVMERQEQDLKKIQRLLSDAESMWKDLARGSDVNRAANQTLMAIYSTNENITSGGENVLNKVTQKLRDMGERLSSTNGDIQRSLTEGNTLTERLFAQITRGQEALLVEVNKLKKNDPVLLQTADNVIANKKRIEYGVHQILAQSADLLSTQSKSLNNTFIDRLNNIEKTIVENQTGALTNISSKIEEEMSKVWLQIGTMYQQLIASKTSLDKLTEHTEHYVNVSSTTMDGMKDKVGTVTAKMIEVDDNLNYLLGRLSIVTEEFNSIKTGLGNALDKVEASFAKVKSKLDNSGPGPHNITSSEKLN